MATCSDVLLKPPVQLVGKLFRFVERLLTVGIDTVFAGVGNLHFETYRQAIGGWA